MFKCALACMMVLCISADVARGRDNTGALPKHPRSKSVQIITAGWPHGGYDLRWTYHYPFGSESLVRDKASQEAWGRDWGGGSALTADVNGDGELDDYMFSRSRLRMCAINNLNGDGQQEAIIRKLKVAQNLVVVNNGLDKLWDLDFPSSIGNSVVSNMDGDGVNELGVSTADRLHAMQGSVTRRVAKYAIAASNGTIATLGWQQVVNTLESKHDGDVFTYSGNVFNLQSELSDFDPDFICFVMSPQEIISYLGGCEQYVRDIHQLTRSLDDDLYGDAIWGILTGYNAEDALAIADGPSEIMVSNALLATAGGWLDNIREGTYFSESEYNVMWTTESCGPVYKGTEGPTDPTDTMVSLLNSNTVDIMVTSGHASQHNWQIHYPNPGLAGFFRSNDGQLYGDPYSGPDVIISSTNPKLYYAPGNCLIADISDMACMALSWMHTGTAHQFCGYTVSTWYGYMGWGIADYYFPLQDRHSFAKAFYLNNQALLFALENNTPGTNPSGLAYDRDVVAFYGDPACDARLERCQDPLYDIALLVPPRVLETGVVTNLDTLVATITMNETGHPRRPPIVLFSGFTVDSAQIVATDAYNAVVTDNFALLDVWHQGDADLSVGEQREVKFTGGSVPTGVADDESSQLAEQFVLSQNYPNPFNSATVISFDLPRAANVRLEIFNILGQKVATPVNKHLKAGLHSVVWDGTAAASGVYLYRLTAAGYIKTKKMALLK